MMSFVKSTFLSSTSQRNAIQAHAGFVEHEIQVVSFDLLHHHVGDLFDIPSRMRRACSCNWRSRVCRTRLISRSMFLMFAILSSRSLAFCVLASAAEGGSIQLLVQVIDFVERFLIGVRAIVVFFFGGVFRLVILASASLVYYIL